MRYFSQDNSYDIYRNEGNKMTDCILNWINDGIRRGYDDQHIADKLGTDISIVKERRAEYEGIITGDTTGIFAKQHTAPEGD
jgi:hypothetical protein